MVVHKAQTLTVTVFKTDQPLLLSVGNIFICVHFSNNPLLAGLAAAADAAGAGRGEAARGGRRRAQGRLPGAQGQARRGQGGRADRQTGGPAGLQYTQFVL